MTTNSEYTDQFKSWAAKRTINRELLARFLILQKQGLTLKMFSKRVGRSYTSLARTFKDLGYAGAASQPASQVSASENKDS